MPSDPSEQFVRSLVASQNSLYAYILTLVPVRETARDLLQDTCVTLWSRSSEFTPGTNFLAWACRVAYFTVLAYKRDRARERTIFADNVLQELAVSGEQQATELDGRTAALDACLKSLPALQRSLILERYNPGMSVAKLAAAKGRSARGLSVTLHRIRQMLMDCVEDRLSTKGTRQ
jgi:RNA polymerase sigma-70 factor, ECF subfamily